jgi:membrane-associated phospholipid phosphatase
VAALATLSALSIAFADVQIARWVSVRPEGVRAFFGTGTGWLDVVSAKVLPDSVRALALFILAVLAWTKPVWRPLAKLLVLVALCHVLSHLGAGMMKPVFGRLRPYQIADAGWVDQYFAGGSSFPSGHSAFYWGIAMPLAWALPRWRLLVLLPPLFVTAARVMTNNHFPSDVLAGAGVAFVVSAPLILLFERKAKLEPFGRMPAP